MKMIVIFYKDVLITFLKLNEWYNLSGFNDQTWHKFGDIIPLTSLAYHSHI
jgi:hypothetical protein